MASLNSDTLARSSPLYERVKRVIPPPEWATFADDVDAILELKRARNAVILAHNYQTPEIFHGVADIVGDSLLLAREATKVDADIIVLAGVHFMAETAKLLNPQKTVLIPDLRAGCSLADSITAQDVRLMRQRYPGVCGRICQHVDRGEGGVRHLLHVGQRAQGGGIARRRARHHAAR
jgi:quinolinate synthase